MKYLFSISLFLISTNIFSQEIKGIVLDQKTNVPIESVAVYFDNTTQGVITNKKGFFSIDYREDVNTPLVISFLGYKKIIFEKYEPNKSYKFLLEEEASFLDEVVIVTKDSWSRELKLKYFKEQFLGKTKNARSCKITNENDLQLYFNKKTNKLIASSKKPLIIINKNLNYKLQYDLQDFEIDFATYYIKKKDSVLKPKLKYYIESMYYSGTTLFNDLETEREKKNLKRRNKAYKGSVLHFMRSLASNALKEEKFEIYSGGFKVDPEHYISIEKLEIENMVAIKILKRITIVYNKKEQSFIVPTNQRFTIDVLGNYNPIRSLFFGGSMSKNRIGDTLPLDYVLEEY